jgi:hypothetical protein
MSKAFTQNASVLDASSAAYTCSDVRERQSPSKTGQVEFSAAIIAFNWVVLVVMRLKGFCTEGAGFMYIGPKSPSSTEPR